MLSDDDLKDLWSRFDVPEWDEWQRKYATLVGDVASLPESAMHDPATQKRLWSARTITPAGPGESIDVASAWTSPEITSAIAVLRTIAWPAADEDRADAIQLEFDRVFDLVAGRGITPKPYAKLHRLFALVVPRHLTCVLTWKANRHAADLLLPAGARRTPLASQVLMRARLRNVLGLETGPTDDARRSTFCWWLHEQYDAIVTGTYHGRTITERIETASPPVAIPGEEPAERIHPWSFTRQLKGNVTCPRMAVGYQDAVQAAQPGLPANEIVAELQSRPEYADASPAALRGMVTRLQALGFLDHRDQRLRPSADGIELLESEQFDVLVDRLIERVYGFAQLLRHLSGAEVPLERDELYSLLRRDHPRWNTGSTPSHLRAWAMSLGLVSSDADRRVALTPYGRAWVARLPDVLPTPPAGVIVLEEDDEAEASPFTAPAVAPPMIFPRAADVLARFAADPVTHAFVYDEALLRSLDAAWRCGDRKRFAILSGLSGTGKTAMARHYAEAACALLQLDPIEHLAVVPVSPEWRDPTGLLGYFNALHAEPTFQAEPALRLVIRAALDPRRPYFLVLDEMNLARVERYFAPFLSAMETGLRSRCTARPAR